VSSIVSPINDSSTLVLCINQFLHHYGYFNLKILNLLVFNVRLVIYYYNKILHEQLILMTRNCLWWYRFTK